MGRESSHGTKELFSLPPLVLKARHPMSHGSAFCIGFSRLEVPEQTLSGIPLGLGMVMKKINFLNFHVHETPGNDGFDEKIWAVPGRGTTTQRIRSIVRNNHARNGNLFWRLLYLCELLSSV